MIKSNQIAVTGDFCKIIKQIIDVRDDNVWLATMDHLFSGLSQRDAAKKYSCQQYSVSRMSARIEFVARVMQSAHSELEACNDVIRGRRLNGLSNAYSALGEWAYHTEDSVIFNKSEIRTALRELKCAIEMDGGMPCDIRL